MIDTSKTKQSDRHLEEEPKGHLGLGSSARPGEGAGLGNEVNGLLE